MTVPLNLSNHIKTISLTCLHFNQNATRVYPFIVDNTTWASVFQRVCHKNKWIVVSWFNPLACEFNWVKSVWGMPPNGTAIWGGCVTRRKHRVESWYFSQKAVTVQACLAAPVRQGGYGAVFANHVVFLSKMSVAVHSLFRFDWLTVKISIVEQRMCRGILSRYTY